MSFERREYTEFAKRREAKRAATRVQNVRAIEQSEVAAKQLTNSPAWNWFLQIVAALKLNSEAALGEIDAQARVSSDFSHEGLSHVQAIRRGWFVRIATLDEVMDLPGQIIDDAQKAEELLNALKHAESEEKTDSSAAS